MNKAMLASYGRALLATALTAVFAVGKLPWEFTQPEWLAVANAIWVAVIPVLIRWLNPNDTAFGRTK
jgi:hypothetical protein